jgi:4-amino-4-deoxy-L-arabinose transferase-like glycosyltransferase
MLRSHWPLWLLLLIALPLLFFRLGDVPVTWYDEGLNLSAARSLAQTGQYALPSADGARLADPAIQTGPPVILLAAALETFTGPNLVATRTLVALAALAFIIAFYALAFRLYGRVAAVVAVVLLLLVPGSSTANFIYLGRQMLGEIPASLCIVLGLHLLLSGGKGWRVLSAGLLFGLAVAIKSQVLVVLSATVGLFLLYALLRRQDRARWLMVAAGMGLVYGLDTLWRARMAGSSLAANSQVLVQGVFIHILPFRALANLSQWGILLRLGVVGLAAAAILRIRHLHPLRFSRLAVEHVILLFAVVWMLWYALLSIGWDRYAFIGVMFSLLLISGAAAYLWERLCLPANRLTYAGLVAVCGIGAALLYLPTLLSDRQSEQLNNLTAYLQTNIPADATVLSLEWPAAYLTNLHYVLPTTRAVNSITAAYFLNQPYDDAAFDALAACPQYIVLGSFGIEPTIAAAMQAAETSPAFADGAYRVYRIPPENLRHAPDGRCAAKRSGTGDSG